MGHIHPQSSNDDATLPADVEGDGEPESWPKTSVLKSGTTMTVLLSLITSVTATIHNICAILLGHVALRWIPVYPASSHAFVDADFVTTLRLAIIGSSVLVIPLLLATILSPEGRTSKGRSQPHGIEGQRRCALVRVDTSYNPRQSYQTSDLREIGVVRQGAPLADRCCTLQRRTHSPYRGHHRHVLRAAGTGHIVLHPIIWRLLPATSQPMTLAISATYAWIILALSFLRFLTPLLLALCFTQCPVDLLHRLYDAYCVGKIGALNGPSVIRVALLHILKAVGVALTFIVARLPTGSDPVPGPILAPSQAITSMLVGPSVIRVALLHILKAVGVALTFIVARLPTGSDPVPGPILAPSQAITSMLVGKFTIYVVRVWLVSQGRLARDNFEDPDCESDEDGRDECPGNNCEHHRPSKLV
ncbi:hypothetical protein C8T65DRAFT_825684 [Cerioporus squamosus]|nr:hypothetical protein C8T65DRAFT_825684 [Cerioporus squamosus]